MVFMTGGGRTQARPIEQFDEGSVQVPGPVDDPIGYTVTAPGAWTGTAEGGNGEVVVSTEAIRYVAGVIDSYRPVLTDLLDQLSQVDIAPGAFHHAVEMRSRVVGAEGNGGLKDDLSTTLANIIEGVADVSGALQQIAAGYDNADTRNVTTAADVQRLMGEALTDVGANAAAAAPQQMAAEPGAQLPAAPAGPGGVSTGSTGSTT
ncbi:hypothetical protein ACFWN2_07495 [Lentzea sp. NPDC058436]|uniref:hypothetical protein n=1 Tax=Lentzea sp. NPDC058436 TaxID=3346499 RepID=UPI00364FEC30